MDAIQEKHKRAVGDAFVDWYNKLHGNMYQYYGRGADPPDLVYTGGAAELLLEVTGTYYDAGHATVLWRNARGIPEAANSWSGKSPDQKLIDGITLAFEKKSSKVYPSRCILVVVIYPDLATAEEFADLIPAMHVPAGHPFADIYVGGLFPASNSGSVGGYFWWRLSSA